MSAVAHHGGAPILRKQVEAQIERLIALLDDIDGDPDFEAEEDNDTSDYEPSLCGINMPMFLGSADDCEADGPAFKMDQSAVLMGGSKREQELSRSR